jgi:hypothetical protein
MQPPSALAVGLKGRQCLETFSKGLTHSRMTLCGHATETVNYAVGQIVGKCALSLFHLNAPGSRVIAEHLSRPDKVHRSV